MGQFCNRVRDILSQSHLTHLQGVYFGFFTIIFVNETNNQQQMKTYILRNLTVASAMLTLFLSGLKPSSAQSISKAWNPDRGTHYINPVINADYPGAPWSDERPWEALGHGVREVALEVPGALEWKTVPQHGYGVWAPAIRYHDGDFYIYCGDPDRGIFMVKTTDPSGAWDEPVWVLKAKGFIDPCPLWDEAALSTASMERNGLRFLTRPTVSLPAPANG